MPKSKTVLPDPRITRVCSGPNEFICAIFGSLGFLFDGERIYVNLTCPGNRARPRSKGSSAKDS